MAYNKVTFDGNTIIDLSEDTVTKADVARGKTFHLADGTQETGTADGEALQPTFTFINNSPSASVHLYGGTEKMSGIGGRLMCEGSVYLNRNGGEASVLGTYESYNRDIRRCPVINLFVATDNLQVGVDNLNFSSNVPTEITIFRGSSANQFAVRISSTNASESVDNIIVTISQTS